MIALSLLCLTWFTASTITVEVEPNMSHLNYEHFKTLTLNCSPSGIDHIEGFEFEWGYRYTLEVEETILPETLSDGTRAEYRLKQVVSKEPVAPGTTFSLHLDGMLYYHDDPDAAPTLVRVDAERWRYFDQVEFVVPESLQQDLERIAKGGLVRTAVCAFREGGQIELVRWKH